MALWTSRQTADYCNFSERHLARLRRAGTGPRYIRAGIDKAVRYDPPDVTEWLETQKVSSTSEESALPDRRIEAQP